ncbi:hypothetical protein UP17_17545 [Peribacillus simplex]|nr:hypothetical protein UP17_17545 [Peribacillus simplex]
MTEKSFSFRTSPGFIKRKKIFEGKIHRKLMNSSGNLGIDSDNRIIEEKFQLILFPLICYNKVVLTLLRGNVFLCQSK